MILMNQSGSVKRSTLDSDREKRKKTESVLEVTCQQADISMKDLKAGSRRREVSQVRTFVARKLFKGEKSFSNLLLTA